MQPKVSIVVPTFNRYNSIVRCVESVKNQNFKNWELIVVDDGSTDGTDQLILKYQMEDKRIKYLVRNESRLKGANACRNIGIESARGKYVAFLDSDDEWLPHKLSRDIAKLHINPSILGLYSGILIDDGQERFKSLSRSLNKGEGYVDFIFSKNIIAQTSTYIVSAKSARQIKFDEELQRHQDLDFFIRFGKVFGWHYLDECNALIHWGKNEKRTFHFPSMIKYYEKYCNEISSFANHSNYLLRAWIKAKNNDQRFKNYYVKKMREMFFEVGLKYKLFCIAPEFFYFIWLKLPKPKSNFSVYPKISR